MRKFFTYIIAIFCLSVGFASSAKAQSINGSDLAISAQGWYGFDIEKSRPNLTSYGYMNYEAAVGIQTKPENQNPFAEAFGFPLIDIGISIARAGNFKFSDQTHFPNLYSAYGSFERSILRTERFSAGYLLTFGATYNPAKYAAKLKNIIKINTAQRALFSLIKYNGEKGFITHRLPSRS